MDRNHTNSSDDRCSACCLTISECNGVNEDLPAASVSGGSLFVCWRDNCCESRFCQLMRDCNYVSVYILTLAILIGYHILVYKLIINVI